MLVFCKNVCQFLSLFIFWCLHLLLFLYFVHSKWLQRPKSKLLSLITLSFSTNTHLTNPHFYPKQATAGTVWIKTVRVCWLIKNNWRWDRYLATTRFQPGIALYCIVLSHWTPLTSCIRTCLTKTDIPYQLRTRPHRMRLINKSKFLNDTNFIIRLLYKHSY